MLPNFAAAVKPYPFAATCARQRTSCVSLFMAKDVSRFYRYTFHQLSQTVVNISRKEKEEISNYYGLPLSNCLMVKMTKHACDDIKDNKSVKKIQHLDPLRRENIRLCSMMAVLIINEWLRLLINDTHILYHFSTMR